MEGKSHWSPKNQYILHNAQKINFHVHQFVRDEVLPSKYKDRKF